MIRGTEALRGCVDAECTDGADLVALGMGSTLGDSQHGPGGLAEAMIARSQAPVVLIPPSAPPPPRSIRVLALLDGSGKPSSSSSRSSRWQMPIWGGGLARSRS